MALKVNKNNKSVKYLGITNSTYLDIPK